MVQVSAEEAGQRFEELLRQVAQGQSIEIMDGERPVAVILPAGEIRRKRRFGSAKGLFTVPDDIEDPLPDLEEYMP